MKITLVGSGVVSIPPKRGGATELIIYELSKHLPKKGFEIIVYDLKESTNKKYEIMNGSVYERFSVPRLDNVLFLRLSEFLFGVRSLFHTLNNKTDIVHCQTVFSALPFTLLKHFGCKKLVYTSHNPAWTAEKNDLLNKIILRLEAFVMKAADSNITVSKTMKEGIIKKTDIKPNKIHVIYNFVDSKKFHPRKNLWKGKIGINCPMVLFVGKLSENKGVEYFLRAAKKVIDSKNNVKFVLVGPMSFEYKSNNKWTELVKDLDIENNVIFTDALSDEELPDAYSSADVFCFPTLKEAFGIVVIEAMASGVPVITSDISVLREIVEKNGIFVKLRDDDAIAKSILDLLNDEKTRKTLGKTALRHSKSFAIEKIMEDYSKFYRKIK